MWLFTKDGFYSVTQATGNASKVVVRTRAKDDLKKLVHQLAVGRRIRAPRILDTPTRDYHWRIVISRADWVWYAQKAAMDIDYSNFKKAATTGDPRRTAAYLDVWWSMLRFQGPKILFGEDEAQEGEEEFNA